MLKVPAQHHIFTVDDYHRMGEAGIFDVDERVELIRGEVITMSPIGIRHAACVNRVNAVLSAQIGQQALVSVQNPIRISDVSEPEPDIALLAYRDDYYASALPTGKDVLLAIEVSDSTLAYDRLTKVPLYAEAGIPEVWIINLVDNSVEIFQQLQDGRYAITLRPTNQDKLQPTKLENISVAVADLIP